MPSIKAARIIAEQTFFGGTLTLAEVLDMVKALRFAASCMEWEANQIMDAGCACKKCWRGFKRRNKRRERLQRRLDSVAPGQPGSWRH